MIAFLKSKHSSTSHFRHLNSVFIWLVESIEQSLRWNRLVQLHQIMKIIPVLLAQSIPFTSNSTWKTSWIYIGRSSFHVNLHALREVYRCFHFSSVSFSFSFFSYPARPPYNITLQTISLSDMEIINFQISDFKGIFRQDSKA